MLLSSSYHHKQDSDVYSSRFLFHFAYVVFLPILGALLYRYFFKPYLSVRFYKTQGAAGHYHPFLSFLLARSRDVFTHGDFMHYFKDILTKRPEVRMIISSLGSRPLLFLTDPDLVREFQNTLLPNYKKAQYVSDIGKIFLGEGVLFAEGETWKAHRKLLAGAFHSESLRDSVPLLSSTTNELYDKLSVENLKDIDLLAENERVMNEVFGRYFFGPRFSQSKFEDTSLSSSLGKFLDSSFSELSSKWGLTFLPQVFRTRLVPRHRHLATRLNGYRTICKSLIIDKKKLAGDIKEPTLLQVLVDQQKHSPENCLTDEEIIDTYLNLAFPSCKQVSALASMALHYLSRNPVAYEKIMAEIASLVGDSREFSYEQIQGMDYTLSVLKETMRLVNPVGFILFRTTLRDHKLGNVNIKKGTLVTYSPLMLTTNAKYVPDAGEFKPERWQDPAMSKLREDSAFNAFAAGPRNCIGQNLALIQGRIMLASFLMRFKVQSCEESESPRMIYTTTYHPVKPLRMNLTVQ